MKKRYLLALFSVLIVILFVTTIIQVMGLGFLSESNIYTGDRFKFKYPSEYKITEVKGNSTFLIAKNTQNQNLTFQISKSL